MTTLRFGIVGAGFITRFQTVAMKQVRGLEFAGITQHRGSAAVVKLAKEIGTGEPRIYPSLGEMAQHQVSISNNGQPAREMKAFELNPKIVARDETRQRAKVWFDPADVVVLTG